MPLPSSVRVGGMDARELREALRGLDVRLNEYAEALLADPRFTTLPQRTVVEIASLSVGELGFAEGATYARLAARALESGLVEGPLELGPHLRLQFLDQPEGSPGSKTTPRRAPPGSITVASPALDDADDTPKGFYLQRLDGVSWLRGYRSWPGHVFGPQDAFVFRRMTS